MTGLAMLVQQDLCSDPFGGSVIALSSPGVGLIKRVRHDGVDLCILTKRWEQGQSGL